MRADIANLVKNAFSIVDGLGLTESVSVKLVAGVGAYNADTDNVVEVYTELPDLRVVFTRVTLEEIDSSNVISEDSKVLVSAVDLNGVEPKQNDELMETVSGVQWNVQKVRGVPGKSLYILFVRKK